MEGTFFFSFFFFLQYSIYKIEGAAVLFWPPGWSELVWGQEVQQSKRRVGCGESQHPFLLHLRVEGGRRVRSMQRR